MTTTAQTEPTYLRQVIDLARRVAKVGTVTVIDVLHDPDCAHWAGLPCDCKPDVRLRVRGGLRQ